MNLVLLRNNYQVTAIHTILHDLPSSTVRRDRLYHWREPVTSFTYCHPSPASPPKPNLTLSFPRTLSLLSCPFIAPSPFSSSTFTLSSHTPLIRFFSSHHRLQPSFHPLATPSRFPSLRICFVRLFPSCDHYSSPCRLIGLLGPLSHRFFIQYSRSCSSSTRLGASQRRINELIIVTVTVDDLFRLNKLITCDALLSIRHLSPVASRCPPPLTWRT